MKFISLESKKDLFGLSMLLGVTIKYFVDQFYFTVPCPAGVKVICSSNPGFPFSYKFNGLDAFIIFIDFIFFPAIIFIILFIIRFFRKKNSQS